MTGAAAALQTSGRVLVDDSVDVPVEQYFCLALLIHKHDAIAELGMAGDYASAKDYGLAIEPEFD
jgi:hypothetical protein